jgi:hypothetical protein
MSKPLIAAKPAQKEEQFARLANCASSGGRV